MAARGLVERRTGVGWRVAKSVTAVCFSLLTRRGSDILAASVCAQWEGCRALTRTLKPPVIHFGKGKAMATYVTLFNYTEKGTAGIKDTLKRLEAAKAAAKQIGMTVKEVLWLQGQYDGVIISEGSDEIAMTAFTLNTLKAGNVRMQTLRAFTAAEMGKILEKVS